MASAFFGIEIVKKILQTYQKAQDVTAHNIANVNTKGYSRQRPLIKQAEPISILYGQVGTGVEVAKVIRIWDQYIADRLRNETRNKSLWERILATVKEIEKIFNEPSDIQLSALLDQFFTVFDELSKNPENLAFRENVIKKGEKLTSTINHIYSRLVDLQLQINEEIKFLVNEINSKAHQIADLNKKIREIEVNSHPANDLRDKRDLLIDELSELVNVSYQEWKHSQIAVYISSRILVQDEHVVEVKTQQNVHNPLKLDIIWSDEKTLVNITGGKLKALLEARDKILEYYMDKLDELSEGLIREVNTLHHSGFGLKDASGIPSTGYNFFTNTTLQILRTNNPNIYYKSIIQGIERLPVNTSRATPLQELGVTAGSFTIRVNGTPYTVNITAAEIAAGFSLGGLLDRIENVANVKAYYNPVNRRVIIERKERQANIKPSLELGDVTIDTSNFLTEEVTGLLTPQVTDPPTPNNPTRVRRARQSLIASDASARIAVNPELKTQPARIAAASTIAGVPGDGSNAALIASLKFENTIGGFPPTDTYEEFYRGIINQAALNVEGATRLFKSYESQVQTLENRKQEISGVSLDEEMVNMIKYQHAYNAAAVLCRTLDEMLETLIMGLGR